MVLFYVYQLKFLYGVAFNVGGVTIQRSEVPSLFLIYGLGFFCVSLVLTLLPANAYRQRHSLGLTPWEVFVTRVSVADHLATALVGLVSAALAQVIPEPATSLVAGSAYLGDAAVKFAVGTVRRRPRAMARQGVAEARSIDQSTSR